MSEKINIKVCKSEKTVFLVKDQFTTYTIQIIKEIVPSLTFCPLI